MEVLEEVADLALLAVGRGGIDAEVAFEVAFEVAEDGLGFEDLEDILLVEEVSYSAALTSINRAAADLEYAGHESVERVADQGYVVGVLAVELAVVVQTQRLAEALEVRFGILVDVADVGVQSGANISHPVVGIELDLPHEQHALVLQQLHQLLLVAPVVAFDLPLPLLCELPTTQSCSSIVFLTSPASSDLCP